MNRHKVLLIVFAAAFAGMAVFESIKQFILPNIGLWQSHVITIGFSSAIALLVGYFTLKKYEELHDYRIRVEDLSALLSRIVERSVNEVYIFNADTLKFILVNRAARENLGYSIDELRSFDPVDLKTEFTSDKFEDLIKPLRDGTSDSIAFQTIHRRKDGSTYDVEAFLQLMPLETPPVFVAIILDITRRKKAEEALKSSEVRFKRLFEKAPLGYQSLDFNGNFIEVNPAWLKMFGFTYEEVIGHWFGDFIAEKHLFGENFPRFKDAGEIVVPEYEMICKDGSSRIVSFNGRVGYDEQGNFLQTHCILVDITDKAQAEDALRTLTSTMVGNIGDEFFNKVIRELCAWLDADVAAIGKIVDGKRIITTSMVIDGEEAEDFEYALKNTPCENVASNSFCFHPRDVQSLFPEDKDLVDLKAEGYIGVPIATAEEKIIGVVWAISRQPLRLKPQWKDVMSIVADRAAAEFERMNAEIILREARAEAEVANRAKSDFLANMSHDLRTPLNAIMGFSEMMEIKAFGPLGDPHYEEYVKDIHSSGDLLVSLINDILDISKVEAGKYELDEENLDVSSLIDSSVKMLSTQAKTGGLRLDTDIEANLSMLRGDEKSIIQILNNLLSNAINFTPPGGKVTISVIDRNGSINIVVADTGEGMSKHDIDKALRPFEQADSHHSRRHEGTGLGLHLCQKLMKLHDGEISLQSEVGKGTSVTVTFPPERTIIS